MRIVNEAHSKRRLVTSSVSPTWEFRRHSSNFPRGRLAWRESQGTAVHTAMAGLPRS